MKEITNENTNTKGAGNQAVNINNATVFVGSPSDMMDEYGDAYEAQEAREEKVINGTAS